MTWAERAVGDPSLRTFVDAEIARAHVELQALRVEVTHWKRVAEEQQRRVEELKQDRDKKGRRSA